jgi:hypothetical protein
MTIPKPKPLPTCVCGSTQFQENPTTLVLREENGGTMDTFNKEVWARVCQQCSQVTLWAKKSGT